MLNLLQTKEDLQKRYEEIQQKILKEEDHFFIYGLQREMEALEEKMLALEKKEKGE